MSHLTKEQLRDAIISHGLDPPPAQSVRKDELVAIYREVSGDDLGNRGGLFSSDDDDELMMMGGSPGGKKKGSQSGGGRRSAPGGESSSGAAGTQKRKSVSRSGELLFISDASSSSSSLIVDGEDLTQISDDELYTRLKEFNAEVGPIVETTRILYQRKLANLLREGGVSSPSTSNGQKKNGHNKNGQQQQHKNGLDKFSADEEEEESSDEDRQPSPVVKVATRTSARSPKKIDLDTPTSIRQRFADATASPSSPGGRFTPTPRRSIHSYKVTETTKHVKVKTPDGSVSHDYTYSREAEEGKESEGGGVNGIVRIVVANLPKIFMLMLLVAAVYYAYTEGNLESSSSYFKVIQDFFFKFSSNEASESLPRDESSIPLRGEPLDEQPSISNV